MNAAKQAAWLFIVLILLACSGWYFARTDLTHKLDNNTLATMPDAIINDLTVRQFDDKGQLVNHLQTPLLRHIPRKDTHLLKNPHIVIAQENQAPWDIQSGEAIAINGGKQITFLKNVIVHQNKTANSQESTMRTEAIIYYPETKKATTSLLVTFEQPGTIVKSMGMNAYLNEKKVELLHKARGQYVPAHG